MSITIEHLTKSYGKSVAVDDVSIDIPSGSVFGLLGPNGAGKTTTFKCLLGLATPTSGTFLFDGKPLTPKTFEQLAYVPERSVLYDWMTGAQHLEMQKRAFARHNEKRATELDGVVLTRPSQTSARDVKGHAYGSRRCHGVRDGPGDHGAG